MNRVQIEEILQYGCPRALFWDLLFHVYIDDLAVGLKCNKKLLVEDKSLFTAAESPNIAFNEVNHELKFLS